MNRYKAIGRCISWGLMNRHPTTAARKQSACCVTINLRSCLSSQVGGLTVIRPGRKASTASNGNLYCDRFYAARQLALPREIRSNNDVIITVDYARYSEVTSSLREMLQSASERGDNIGEDEFDGANYDQLIEYSFILAARCICL